MDGALPLWQRPHSLLRLRLRRSLGGARALKLQDLDGLREDELAVDALLGHVADHAVPGEELRELLEGAGSTVADVVVVVVAEGDGVFRRELGRVDAVAEDLVRLARLIGGLPDVRAVVVLELADLGDGAVVHDEGRVLAVRPLEGVDEGEQVVRRKRRRERVHGGAAAVLREQAEGLADSGAVEERVLLGVGESLAELGDDVVLQIEGVVVEQLLRDLDRHVQLVGVHQDLGEGGVGELERAAFLDPRGGGLGGRDVDLVLAGGRDDVAELAHDVLLLQGVDQPVVVLLRHEVAAVRVHALLQDVADLAEVGAQSLQHAASVLVGCATGLCRCGAASGHGLSGQGRVDGLGELALHVLLTLHAGNLSAHVHDLLLHLVVGLVVLVGQGALVSAVGLREVACGLKRLTSLLHKL